MDVMTISELAKAGDVGVETVRFYQRSGLVETPEKLGGNGLSGGIRRYGDKDVRRLRFIRAAKGAGFTLDQIRELMSLDAGEDRARAHALACKQLAVLDAKIANLETARAALQLLARECAQSGEGPCPILSSFGV